MYKKYFIPSMLLLYCLPSIAVINTLGQEITITSTIKTAERILGQVDISIDKDGKLSIATADLTFILEKILPEADIQRLNKASINNQLTDSILEKMGFPITLDPQTFEILISIPIDKNRVNLISLSPKPIRTNLYPASKINGFLNIFLNASYDRSSKGVRNYNQFHSFQAGLNSGAANLTYDAELLSNTKVNTQFNRTFSQFTYDLPSQGTRFLFGDINPPTTSFQANSTIVGVGVLRNFSNIPTRSLHSTGSRQFTLTRSSDVDVLIDGVVLQRLTLPAGRYDLNDIPLARGNNNVELVIRDNTGKEERISFSIVIDNELIKQGEFEYAFTSGLPSSIKNNKLNYDDENIFTSAFIKYGLLPSWTAGSNGQYYDNNYQFGLLSLNAWRFGTTELIYNQSHHAKYGKGDAFKLSYATPQELQSSFNLQFNAQYEHFSSTFNHVNFDPIDKKNNIQHNLRMSLSSTLQNKYNTGLNFNLQKAYLDKENNWSLSTTLSGPIADTRATFGLNLRYLNNFDKQNEFDFITTFTFPFENKHRFVSQYRKSGNELHLNYSYKNRTDTSGGTAINANMIRNNTEELALNTDVNYTANRFNLGFEHDTRYESLTSKDTKTSTKVSLATAIAFSGSEIAVGRPVENSFAVIAPNDNLRNNKILVLPTGDDNAHVVSYKARNVLISNLSSYSQQSIGFDIKDLPSGYDLGAGLYTVNPIKGQGYQIKLGTDSAMTMMAVLINKKTNEPIGLIAGKAYKKSEPKKLIDFFTTKRGRLAISGMSSGVWILELNTKPAKKIEILVINNNNMLDNKGKILVDL